MSKREIGLEIFSPSGKVPFLNFENGNQLSKFKIYDRSVKGSILSLEQQNSRFPLKFIKPPSLLINQNLFCLQLFLYEENSFKVEINLIDSDNLKRRVYFSTNSKEIESNVLHAKIPWRSIENENWATYIINLNDICQICFNSSFSTFDSLSIFPCCKIRKIFMVPSQMVFLNEQIVIPNQFDFPSGVFSKIVSIFPFNQDNLSVLKNLNSMQKVKDSALEVKSVLLYKKITQPSSQKSSNRPFKNNPLKAKSVHEISEILSKPVIHKEITVSSMLTEAKEILHEKLSELILSKEDITCIFEFTDLSFEKLNLLENQFISDYGKELYLKELGSFQLIPK